MYDHYYILVGKRSKKRLVFKPNDIQEISKEYKTLFDDFDIYRAEFNGINLNATAKVNQDWSEKPL